jgi:hypothetical protein
MQSAGVGETTTISAYRPLASTTTRSNVVETRQNDSVAISNEAQQALKQEAATQPVDTSQNDKDPEGRSERTQQRNGVELNTDELRLLRKLSQRDREVRSHEQAHQTVGGQYAGSASYTYQTGPDRRRYAVGGEVDIDTGKESKPEATLRKARIVRRAALAPAEPSAQDRSVAATASVMEAEAQREIISAQMEARREQADKQDETGESQQDQTASESETLDSKATQPVKEAGATVDNDTTA